MKKSTFFLSAMILAAGCSGNVGNNNKGSNGQRMGVMDGSQEAPNAMMTPSPACSGLSADEQNFAGQIMDMQNQMMFCSQFTSQQRQQAMQMMGQSDSTGNKMSADKAVQQVMQTNGMMPPAAQSKARTSGGSCPVK